MGSDLIIELNKSEGPVYVGRAQGEAARIRLALDSREDSATNVEITLPDNIYSMNSSYFLGLFAESVKKMGSKEAFKSKYHFHGPEYIMGFIDDYIDRALLEKQVLIDRR